MVQSASFVIMLILMHITLSSMECEYTPITSLSSNYTHPQVALLPCHNVLGFKAAAFLDHIQ